MLKQGIKKVLEPYGKFALAGPKSTSTIYSRIVIAAPIKILAHIQPLLTQVAMHWS